MKAQIKNLQKKHKINSRQIKKTADTVGKIRELKDVSLVFYFVTNSQIKALNRRFLGKNRLTDVIAFGLDQHCAEIFIAPGVVFANAVAYRVAYEQELLRCVIHGMLHVAGYADYAEKEKTAMWKRQESLLKKFF